MQDGIHNAIIESAFLGEHDGGGFLDASIFVNYGGACQGFGGYVLYAPQNWKHHKLLSAAGHHIWRLMKVAGVDDWSKMKGRAIRVKVKDGLIKGVGHIIEDDWFIPSEDYATIDKADITN